MIILSNKKFIAASFSNEEEIERVAFENAEYIFGPDSILLPKSLIRSADGSGTIPDGFAIDFSSRRWFIVEAELSSHSVWTHIAPQVSKQIVASQQPSSRKLLIEIVVNRVRDDKELKEKIEEMGIPEINIRRVLTEIFESPPIVGIPIDQVTNDLREWAQTIKNEVKLWVVRKLVNLTNQTEVLYEIPDEFRPAFDTSDGEDDSEGSAFYDVTLLDLISKGLLAPGQRLYLSYKPRGGDRQQFIAIVKDDGDIEVEGRSYSAPSYAALYCIQKAGSDRNTVNGWTSWKTGSGSLLSELREEYLKKK